MSLEIPANNQKKTKFPDLEWLSLILDPSRSDLDGTLCTAQFQGLCHGLSALALLSLS